MSTTLQGWSISYLHSYNHNLWRFFRYINTFEATSPHICSLGSHKMKGSDYSTLAVPTTALPIPLTLHSIFLVHLLSCVNSSLAIVPRLQIG